MKIHPSLIDIAKLNREATHIYELLGKCPFCNNIISYDIKDSVFYILRCICKNRFAIEAQHTLGEEVRILSFVIDNYLCKINYVKNEIILTPIIDEYGTMLKLQPNKSFCISNFNTDGQVDFAKSIDKIKIAISFQ